MLSSIRSRFVLAAAVAAASALAAGCTSPSAEEAPPAHAPITITAVAVQARPVDRFIRVIGSLVADAQAEVSAESGGRVVATPIERGTRVEAGAVLVRVSPAEADAQLQGRGERRSRHGSGGRLAEHGSGLQ